MSCIYVKLEICQIVNIANKLLPLAPSSTKDDATNHYFLLPRHPTLHQKTT